MTIERQFFRFILEEVGPMFPSLNIIIIILFKNKNKNKNIIIIILKKKKINK